MKKTGVALVLSIALLLLSDLRLLIELMQTGLELLWVCQALQFKERSVVPQTKFVKQVGNVYLLTYDG